MTTSRMMCSIQADVRFQKLALQASSALFFNDLDAGKERGVDD